MASKAKKAKTQAAKGHWAEKEKAVREKVIQMAAKRDKIVAEYPTWKKDHDERREALRREKGANNPYRKWARERRQAAPVKQA